MTSFVNKTDISENSEGPSTDSESIFWCLKEVTEKMDLKPKKLVGFCSDRASNDCYDW